MAPSDEQPQVAPASALARTRSRLRLAAEAAACAAGAVVLYAFRPRAGSFYPPCPFHSLTGLYCPGCGMTRATHYLLHGDLSAAWGYNPVLVLSVPVFGWLALRHARRVLWPRSAPRPLRPGWGNAVIALLLVFGVLRNIPREPFARLAPHGKPAARRVSRNPARAPGRARDWDTGIRRWPAEKAGASMKQVRANPDFAGAKPRCPSRAQCAEVGTFRDTRGHERAAEAPGYEAGPGERRPPGRRDVPA